MNKDTNQTTPKEYFAVIDTETNFDDEVMSIGIVIADCETMAPVDGMYYIIDPAYKRPAMYASVLRVDDAVPPLDVKRPQAIDDIRTLLKMYDVKKLMAYNASFDYNHLPELADYQWYDIMRLAAYRQYNSKIPEDAECFATGKLRNGYSVENILRMLRDDKKYSEVHNAYTDAMDELDIVRLLGHGIDEYEAARIKKDVKPTSAANSKTYNTANNTSGDAANKDAITSGEKYTAPTKVTNPVSSVLDDKTSKELEALRKQALSDSTKNQSSTDAGSQSSVDPEIPYILQDKRKDWSIQSDDFKPTVKPGDDLSYPDPDAINTDKLWAQLTSGTKSAYKSAAKPVSDALESGALAVLKMISKGLK